MAKHEAEAGPARSTGEEAETSPTMLFAAEEQARALKAQLLESTEQATRAILDETRAEGDRRIDGATRQAQAIATTVSEIEHAERALTGRARTFAAASKALRAELESFSAILSEGERRLSPGAGKEPEPQLVTGEVSEDSEEAGFDEGDADLVDQREDDDRPGPASEVSGAEYEIADEDEDFDDDDPADDEGRSDDDAGDRPTPEQFARLFGESADSGSQRPYDASEEDGEVALPERKRGERSERIKRFFAKREEPGETEMRRSVNVTPVSDVVRYSRRDKLAAELTGALVGMAGTVALLRFVLLD